MSMIITEKCAEERILRVHVKGDFSLAEAERTFLEVLAAVAHHKVKKVLFDGREIRGNPSIIDRYYYGKFAALTVGESGNRGVGSFTKFAFLLAHPVLDPRRFGETVARNRGMNVRAYDKLEAALEWLEGAPANESDAADS